jgi:UDP-3-O-[3-hydroxymyristoyl] glucosamine N-acyltransferase
MQVKVRDIAGLIRGEVVGNPDAAVTGIAGIREAQEGDITFLANPKYLPLLEKTKATAAITGRDIVSSHCILIRTDNPSLAFSTVIEKLLPSSVRHPQGIHPSAVIASSARIGAGVGIGAHAVVEQGAQVGDGAVVYPGCYIGANARIGAGCVLYANVSIREDVVLGARVIVHSGTVIGSDGFGFVTVEGAHRKIPQVGTVEVGDDVEIGANVAIDRARFDKTVIGRGTKIDNLVHIAHNVQIGEHSLIVAQVGISGSTVIGNHVTLAGQAGLVGHISVGDNAIVAAQAGVTKSVPAGTMVSGYPAKNHADALKTNACVQNLPRLYEAVKLLQRRIEELEAQLKSHG